MDRPSDTADTISVPPGVSRWFEFTKCKTFALLDRHASSSHEKVKIAILDTGIDGKHPNVQCYNDRIKGYMSLVEPVVKPYHSSRGIPRKKLEKLCIDDHGSGTHSASVLSRMNPYAEIFVCRVAAGASPTSESLVSAINHAASEWCVDIISISVGLEKNVEDIELAIERAVYERQVLFFAAARDEPTGQVAFPARWDPVFCIKSANYAGIQMKPNPVDKNKSGKVYSTLGENVPADWPLSLAVTGINLQSGSCTATHIAAAIAALLLEFARQKSPVAGLQSPIMQRIAPQMKQHWFMERILDSMSNNLDGSKFIRPWQWLDVERDIRLSTQGSDCNGDLYSARNRFEFKLLELYDFDHILSDSN